MNNKRMFSLHITARRIIAFLFIVALCSGIVFFIVKDRQRTAALEQRAYERLDSTDNPLWYEDFVLRFPDSEHFAEVQQRYEELLKR